MSSFTDLTGNDGCTTSSCGIETVCDTGAKSYANANFHSDGNGRLHANANTDTATNRDANTSSTVSRSSTAMPIWQLTGLPPADEKK